MDTDILIVGSGIAGLFYSLKIPSKYKVIIITKKEKREASTNYAQAGIAAVFGRDDSFELHIEDTLRVGDGLSDRERVELMVRDAPRLVDELYKLGCQFVLNEEGGYDLGREAAHSKRRIVHAKDKTGATIEKTLISRVLDRENIEIIEDRVAVDLIMKDNRCTGLWVYDHRNNTIEPLSAKVTLLATGGIGHLYLHTTNPSVCTGDGVAMAKRGGLRLSNMEFIQFHPTSLWTEKKEERAFLISETVRGEGGVLVLKNGEPFMQKYHKSASLAPRDVVARAIASEMKKTGDKYVFLDLSKLSSQKIKDRFPNIYEGCISRGIDITKDPIPCVPAAHYMCGGILVDENGWTGVEGLYSAGETACAGVHGANRLASNSLLESLVFSERAAYHSASNITTKRYSTGDYRAKKGDTKEGMEIMMQRIKQIMWYKVGIVRRVTEMIEAKKELTCLKEEIDSLWENRTPDTKLLTLRNMILSANIIVTSTLQRKESRGLHFVEDYPDRDKKNEK